MITIIKEIFSRPNLIRELVLKDLKLRYSRPALGFFWAFILPLTTVGIYYVIFSVFLRARVEEAPFVLYLMTGVFPWVFFHSSVISSTTSLVDNRNLIRESNFPYYFLPLSIVLANMINFLPSLAILIVTALSVLKGLPLSLIFLPFVLLIHLSLITGLSLISSLLYVKYRDLKYVIDILLALIFNLTPAFYSLYLVKNALPPFLYHVYLYNPFTGILILYRSVILNGFYGIIEKETIFLITVIITTCFSFLMLLSGFLLYNRNKNKINDYLSC